MYIKDIMDRRSLETSFHMPGHKGNYTFFENDISFYDLTEYSIYDNLQNPKTFIKNSIDRISRLYKSETSFILTNGSTVGILASMLYASYIGGEILSCRASHKSFFNGLTITGQKATYYSKIIDENGFFCNINMEEIKNILDTNKNIKSLFITSPTYEGVHFDIKSLSALCKERDVLLIVDEAHGAHFPFSDKFLDSSVPYADIVINSLHKTMPSLTQCALLHTKDMHKDKLLQYINMLQTSSPSYVFLYSIDKLMEDIENNILDFDAYASYVIDFRKKLSSLRNIFLLDSENTDITRITLFSYKASGKDINDFLEQHNIFPEMHISNYVVLISTVCDRPEDFDTLLYILREYDKFLDDKSLKKVYNNFPEVTPLFKYTFKEVDTMPFYKATLKECIGKVSKGFIIPYPPGIPLVLSGEIITETIVKTIEDMLLEDIEIFGMKDNYIEVID